MAKHAPSFICQNCGAVYDDRWQGKCEACGELPRAPPGSFASLLMSVPSDNLERDHTPVRDVDL
jgi:predicted ATP-dependent serine protease